MARTKANQAKKKSSGGTRPARQAKAAPARASKPAKKAAARPAPKKAAAKKPAPKKVAPKKAVAKKAAPKKVAVKKAAPVKAASKKVAAKKGEPKKAAARPAAKAPAAKAPAAKAAPVKSAPAAPAKAAPPSAPVAKPAAPPVPAPAPAAAPPKPAPPLKSFVSPSIAKAGKASGARGRGDGEPNGNAFSPAFLEKQRQKLLTKKAEILAMYKRDLQSGQESNDSPTEDIVDRANNAYSRELAFSISDNERELMLQIDQAIARLDGGSYGFCLHTGQPIGLARLEAIPWAKYGVEAQEMLEKGLLSEA